jgi:hypothetical protein
MKKLLLLIAINQLIFSSQLDIYNLNPLPLSANWPNRIVKTSYGDTSQITTYVKKDNKLLTTSGLNSIIDSSITYYNNYNFPYSEKNISERHEITFFTYYYTNNMIDSTIISNDSTSQDVKIRILFKVNPQNLIDTIYCKYPGIDTSSLTYFYDYNIYNDIKYMKVNVGDKVYSYDSVNYDYTNKIVTKKAFYSFLTAAPIISTYYFEKDILQKIITANDTIYYDYDIANIIKNKQYLSNFHCNINNRNYLLNGRIITNRFSHKRNYRCIPNNFIIKKANELNASNNSLEH